MEIVVYILIAIFAGLFIFKYYINKSKSHEVYKLLDKYGTIQILDNDGLVAIVYRNRTIDWMRSTSLFKMIKVKEISDHFEEEYNKLIEEEIRSCH